MCTFLCSLFSRMCWQLRRRLHRLYNPQRGRLQETLFHNMETILEVEVRNSRKKTLTLERSFRHFMTIILFLMIVYICMAFICAPKNYYTTSSEMKKQKLQQLSQLICGYSNRAGNFCHTPCWNGARYREPHFLLNPGCNKYHNTTLLIYAYSALKNTKRRQILREHFTQEFNSTGNSVMLVFIVGEYKNSSMGRYMKNIKKESNIHRDIIQIDVEDSYFTLGFKALGFFKWIEKCGSDMPKVLAKIDDDDQKIFSTIHPYMALTEQNVKLRNIIICGTALYHNKAHEPKFKKTWQSSLQQYFGTFYPSYCQGDSGMFMSRSTALLLFEAAKGQRIFHLDDVYVSGLLRQKACIDLVDHGGPFMFIVNVMYKFLSFTESLQVRNTLDFSELDKVS